MPKYYADQIEVDPEDFFDDCSTKEKAYLYTLAMEWLTDLSPKRLNELGLEGEMAAIRITPDNLVESNSLLLLEKNWSRINHAALQEFLNA